MAVDHGTALALAGLGEADPSSLAAAVALWATQRLLPLERGGEFARMLEDCRAAALALHAEIARDAGFVTAFPPALDIVVWAVKPQSFAEAAAAPEGFIIVDFVSATTAGSPVSASLVRAVCLYRDVLPEFCAKHGVELDDIHVLQVRFGTDAAYGRHFLVTVENASGRRSADRYFGVPGRRLRRVRR